MAKRKTNVPIPKHFQNFLDISKNFLTYSAISKHFHKECPNIYKSDRPLGKMIFDQ